MARAIVAINTAARRVEAFGRDVLPSFAKNLDMLRRAFEEGKIDILQVMVARGRVLGVQSQTLDAYVDYYEARADLELALGAEPWANEREER
jgi:outer membrane protein TolC